MTVATLNGSPIVSATLDVPQSGVWTAEVAVDASAAPVGPVTLEIGGETWKGSAYRAGAAQGYVRARVTGGAGGMARSVAPKFYRNAPARLVVEELLGEVGECLSVSSDASLLSRTLPAWSRVSGKASEALRSVVEQIGATWRVLADGSVWVGVEQWPTIEVEHVLVDEDPRTGRLEIAPVSAALRPGMIFSGRRISKVVYSVDSGGFRAVALAADAREAEDTATAIIALVRSLTAGSMYLGLFPARVVSQNADGTLELKPDDTRLPGMSRVPIRYGIPGLRATVAADARVGIEFEAGDPARPVATVWESASVTELVFDGGTKGVARVDDAVGGGTFSAVGVAPGAPIQFIYTPQGGAPLPASPTVTIAGKVTAGSTKLKA